jgi:hypothetical protein
MHIGLKKKVLIFLREHKTRNRIKNIGSGKIINLHLDIPIKKYDER